MYLESAYVLTEDVHCGMYQAVLCDRRLRETHDFINPGHPLIGMHGPAFVQTLSDHLHDVVGTLKCLIGMVRSIDFVPSIRCLSWPSQTAEWLTRQRKYGWPDSATIDRVTSNGCDVVGVAHRQCRQHEWMNKHQWRLSFSRAEIVLINSWIPEQQIVYHMLRVFVKSWLSSSSDEFADRADTLKNYHIKTLMLWACELRPRSWWTEDKNLVEICVELLHRIGDWLINAHCEHYFISNCNLLDGSDNSYNQLIGHYLRSVTSKFLARWYIDTYVRKCAELGVNVSRLFDDISTKALLQSAVTAVSDIRRQTMSIHNSSYINVELEYISLMRVSLFSLSVLSTCRWLTELAQLYRFAPIYFVSVAFLHVAIKTTKDSLTDELLDVLATIYRLAGQVSTTDEDLKCFYESVRRFIGDVLGIRSVRCAKNVRCERRLGVHEQ